MISVKTYLVHSSDISVGYEYTENLICLCSCSFVSLFYMKDNEEVLAQCEEGSKLATITFGIYD